MFVVLVFVRNYSWELFSFRGLEKRVSRCWLGGIVFFYVLILFSFFRFGIGGRVRDFRFFRFVGIGVRGSF